MRARLRSRWLLGGGAVVAAFALLIVLALNHTGSRRATASAARGVAASGATNRIAPIKLASVEGARVRLPAGRPGALLFATASCSSCAASAQALGQAKERLGSRIDAAFISIDPNDPPSAVKALRQAVGDPPYPFAVDSTGSLYRAYHVNALGTAVVYDAKGRAVARLIEPDLAQGEAALRKAGVA
jgi:cytochrome oxidase Cu insertion factor (SCO1/SenC/PrrC family)